MPVQGCQVSGLGAVHKLSVHVPMHHISGGNGLDSFTGGAVVFWGSLYGTIFWPLLPLSLIAAHEPSSYLA